MRISDWSSDVCSSIFGPCREGRSLDQLRQLLLVERGHLKRLDAADRDPATRERKRRCGRVTAEVACEVHMSAWRREAVGREPPPHRIGRVEPADEAERPVAPVEPGEEPGAAEADSVGLVAVVAMVRTEAQPKSEEHTS